jgi:diguanylate cyclase (GGDEF)-like protein
MAREVRIWMPGMAVASFAATFVASPAYAQSSLARHSVMTWDGALLGIFFGLLIFSVAYNIAFFALLRERFLIWQSARAMVYLALFVGLSSLPMGEWLMPTSFARQVYICLLFDCGIALSGPFLRAYLEPGMVGPRAYRLLGWLSGITLLTTPAMLLPDCPPLYVAARNLVLVCLLVSCGWVLTRACWRGSRTARNQAVAWSGIVAVYGTSLFHDIVLHRPFEGLLFALIPALGLETILTAIGILDRLNRLRQEREEARAAASALEKIARTDPLTGLANRRAIEERFARQRPVAVALVDLDHFKAVNDRYGHGVGDAVIAAAGAALASGSAVAGRVGGEEFALLFYGDVGLAALEAEALRARVSRGVAERVGEIDYRVTASLGMTMIESELSFAAAMKCADINLYAAKGSGRDRAILPRALAA